MAGVTAYDPTPVTSRRQSISLDNWTHGWTDFKERPPQLSLLDKGWAKAKGQVGKPPVPRKRASIFSLPDPWGFADSTKLLSGLNVYRKAFETARILLATKSSQVPQSREHANGF